VHEAIVMKLRSDKLSDQFCRQPEHFLVDPAVLGGMFQSKCMDHRHHEFNLGHACSNSPQRADQTAGKTTCIGALHSSNLMKRIKHHEATARCLRSAGFA